MHVCKPENQGEKWVVCVAGWGMGLWEHSVGDTKILSVVFAFKAGTPQQPLPPELIPFNNSPCQPETFTMDSPQVFYSETELIPACSLEPNLRKVSKSFFPTPASSVDPAAPNPPIIEAKKEAGM